MQKTPGATASELNLKVADGSKLVFLAVAGAELAVVGGLFYNKNHYGQWTRPKTKDDRERLEKEVEERKEEETAQKKTDERKEGGNREGGEGEGTREGKRTREGGGEEKEAQKKKETDEATRKEEEAQKGKETEKKAMEVAARV